jgi:molecular chaperone HtpG
LHGVIDSPDIPLNVSRSALQTDANVRKINTHITKKVADKLLEIFKSDREQYQEKWPSLEVFVKYGMLSDEKFYEKAKDFCLVQNVKDEYHTLEEYQNLIAALQTDKNNKVVALYTNDVERQHGFVSAAQTKGYDVLKLGHMIDSHFISQLEMKRENFQLKRVDSDVTDKLIEKEENRVSLLTEEESELVKNSFTLLTEGQQYDLQLETLSQDDLPVVITRSEFMRRMKEQSRSGGGMFGMGDFPERFNLVVNSGHPFIKAMATSDEEHRKNMAQKALDLALLSQGMLQGEALTRFIQHSVKIN